MQVHVQTVIGAGEVGESIGQTLKDLGFKVGWVDPKRPKHLPKASSGYGGTDVLHICIPYGPEFIDQVKLRFMDYPAHAVIVHSTVKPGTCEQLASALRKETKALGWHTATVIFSPVRGSHRSNGGLRPALRRLVKYYAVVDPTDGKAEQMFLRSFRGLALKAFPDVRSLEFAKVMSTTYFGWNIAFEKRMHDACVKHGFDFDAAYTDWNETYNAGMPEQFRRPVIEHMEGKIGGHCIIPNLSLLDGIEEVDPLFDEVILWG